MIKMPLEEFPAYYKYLRTKLGFSPEDIQTMSYGAIDADTVRKIESSIKPPDTDEITILLLSIGKDPPKFIFY